jgi:hypothetical protein
MSEEWTEDDDAEMAQAQRDIEVARNWYEAAIRTQCRLAFKYHQCKVAELKDEHQLQPTKGVR